MVQFQENPRHDSILPHICDDNKKTQNIYVSYFLQKTTSTTLCVHFKVSSSFLIMTPEAVESYFPFNFVPMFGTPSKFISLRQETRTEIRFSWSPPSKSLRNHEKRISCHPSGQDIQKVESRSVFYFVKLFPNFSEGFLST